MRVALLDKALEAVPRFGWSQAALEEGARMLGLPGTAHGLGGGAEGLVAHWVARCNEQLLQEHNSGKLMRRATEEEQQQCNDDDDVFFLPMRQRLKLAARYRLELMRPHQNSWNQALQVLAHPKNWKLAAALLHSTADEIVHVAGDESTDWHWYSKRAGVGLIYAAAELHYITDMNPSKEDTWRFLDRRIDNLADSFQRCSELSKFRNHI